VSARTERDSEEMTPHDTVEMLRRILEAVEGPSRHRWMEMTCAAVLALATTASAWCAYESSLWGGVQTFRLSGAARAGRESTQQSLAAVQGHAFDAQMLIAYLQLKCRGDEKLASFLYDRFRPEARKALDVWLLTDPLNNPKAPKRPFEMAEYVQPEVVAAKRLDEEEEITLNAAQQANQTSDKYLLLTVLFASVLFFGGIGGTFHSRRLQWAAFAVAVVLFVATVMALGSMPIYRE
jgi:hypothetical protein